jgi:hypothetical protein
MALKRVHAFGTIFDLVVSRAGERWQVELRADGAAPQVFTLAPGASVSVSLDR